MSKDEALTRTRGEIDSILQNLDRLNERFDQIQTAEEGLVFHSSVLLMREFMDRYMTPSERCRAQKEHTAFLISQIRKNLSEYKKTDVVLPELDTTLKGISRIATTSTSLMFDVSRTNTNERLASKEALKTSYSDKEKDKSTMKKPGILGSIFRSNISRETPDEDTSESKSAIQVTPAPHSPPMPKEKATSLFVPGEKSTLKRNSYIDQPSASALNVKEKDTQKDPKINDLIKIFDKRSTVSDGDSNLKDSQSQSPPLSTVKSEPSSAVTGVGSTMVNSQSANNVGKQESGPISDPIGVQKKDLDLLQYIKPDTDPQTLKLIEEAMKKKGIAFDASILTHKRSSSVEIPSQNPKSAKEDEKRKKELEKNRKTWGKNLMKGTMEKSAKKGKLTTEEVDYLIERAVAPNTTAEEKDRSLVAIILAGWPVEMVPGLRQKVLVGPQASDIMKSVLTMATQGTVSLHHEIPPSEITRGAFIAEGAAARVFRAKYKGHDKDVALKVFNTEHISFSLEEFRKELAILTLLQHENLVPCFGACTSHFSQEGGQGELFVVSELMSKGTLTSYVQNNKAAITPFVAAKFCAEITAGVAFLHSLGLIHRDLKGLNVLLTEDLVCKVIDFGTSRAVDNHMTKNVGTTAWIAPEVLSSNSGYTAKADVYSFAILMWEILTGEEPFKDLKIWAIPQHVLEGKRLVIPPTADKDYADIMKKSWDADPEKRPSMEELHKSFFALQQKLKQ